MRKELMLGGVAKGVGLLLFFAGIFFISQAYTMAFHGIYLDCFGDAGCDLRHYNEPTLTAVLWGTMLALGATVTFYLGVRALRWAQKPPQ